MQQILVVVNKNWMSLKGFYSLNAFSPLIIFVNSAIELYEGYKFWHVVSQQTHLETNIPTALVENRF